ncbi:response regulator [Rhizobium sp. ZPR3]|uniref:Response regulator n=2 Tax=unclassified Rhizobium TaxID=2613769 RepID=A0AAU7SPW0_9HYPH
MDGSAPLFCQMFSGKRLLVAESGYFLADEVRQKLRELGAMIVGPIHNLEYASDLIEANDVDAAILDLNLEPEQVFPLVERLDRQKIPYLFALGGEPIDASMKFTGFVLSKRPVALEHIAKALFGTPDKDT